MRKPGIHSGYEQDAAVAFSQQAPVFDDLYSGDGIIHYKRNRVRQHLQQYLTPASNILEINSGTGEDALWLAKAGHRVHATDISEKMQQVLVGKVNTVGLTNKVSNENCSFTALDQLHNKGPYDLIFSNFAGLNCTPRLDQVLASFDSLLKPGGIVTLVLLPKFCAWEFSLLFKGMFATATRRLRAKHGAAAKIDDHHFRCWYYNPAYVVDHLAQTYTLLKLEGLCTIVPPSYIKGFAEKYPLAFKRLAMAEDKLKEKWPWKYIGDYYIISRQKSFN